MNSWVNLSNRRHDGEGGRVLFRKAVTSRLLPLLRSFHPDLIIMSSGILLMVFMNVGFDGGFRDVGNYRHIPTSQIGMRLVLLSYRYESVS